MQFLFTKGFPTRVEIPNLSIETSGSYSLFCSRSQKTLAPDGFEVALFDGETSVGGEYIRSLITTRAVTISEARRAAHGVFVAGRVRFANESVSAEFVTDPLSQYPLFIYTSPNRYAVSNDIAVLRLFLSRLNLTLTPNYSPVAQNLAIGGIVDCTTHYREIFRIPHGTEVRAGRECVVIRRQDVASPCSYNDALHMFIEEARGYLTSVNEALQPDSKVTADITGGADSRASLSLALSTSIGKRLHGRCLTRYPHPDANVAALLMERLGLDVGWVLRQQSMLETSIRFNADTFGGGRDVGAPPALDPNPHMVSIRGSFGELGGATPGIDPFVGQSNFAPFTAAQSVVGRRVQAKAANILTRQAREYTTQRLSDFYCDIFDDGTELDQIFAESYLRGRCRSHFGWQTAVENRYQITVCPLVSRHIVDCRRALESTQHTNNRVIFDVIQKLYPQLLFLPMAEKKWPEALIDGRLKSSWEEQLIVNTSTPNLSGRTGDRQIPIRVAGLAYKARFPAVPAKEGRNPHDLYVGAFQAGGRFVLDSLDAKDEAWDWIDRSAFIARMTDLDDPTSNGVSVNAFGSALAALTSSITET